MQGCYVINPLVLTLVIKHIEFYVFTASSPHPLRMHITLVPTSLTHSACFHKSVINLSLAFLSLRVKHSILNLSRDQGTSSKVLHSHRYHICEIITLLFCQLHCDLTLFFLNVTFNLYKQFYISPMLSFSSSQFASCNT